MERMPEVPGPLICATIRQAPTAAHLPPGACVSAKRRHRPPVRQALPAPPSTPRISSPERQGSPTAEPPTSGSWACPTLPPRRPPIRLPRSRPATVASTAGRRIWTTPTMYRAVRICCRPISTSLDWWHRSSSTGHSATRWRTPLSTTCSWTFSKPVVPRRYACSSSSMRR
jgi:hypothetical protein